MRIVYTDEPRDDLSKLQLEAVYNGLDSGLTHEIDSVLDSHHDEVSKRIYAFERRCQFPAMLMMLRGVRVDQAERLRMTVGLNAQYRDEESWLDELGMVLMDEPLNARSPKQLQELFYEIMKIKPILKKDHNSGESRPTTDRAALEKISETNFYAQPIINAIFAARDSSKMLGVLKSDVRSGRFYTSYSVAGTGTGRWASRKDVFGSGLNTQNLTKELRRMFIADDGWMLGSCDLEQAESRGVAFLSGDCAYIEACESGDLHTFCARMLWPNLDWTGDLKRDRSIAEAPFFRQFTRRDLSKRAGHLTNYYGKPFTLARGLKIPEEFARHFQQAYFSQFPRISLWHSEVAEAIIRDRQLTTPMGRRRWVFERPNDDATLRKYIAFTPQSMIADIINEGICRVAEKLDEVSGGRIKVLLQVHDCLIFMFREGAFDDAREVQEMLTFPVQVGHREMTIPVDLKVGYDWKNLYSPSLIESGTVLMERPKLTVDPHYLLQMPLEAF